MQADSKKVLNRLKTARGQIDGIIRMVEENQYCIDISNQILAAQAVLQSTNKMILHAHLDHCVRESFANEKDRDEKLAEIQTVIDKLLR
ncbi:MAG TPA: metal-sensing transcriptional repressor [Clostridiaceae bacterium]|nr:metal-sensing transcriptional repressor [Clostridiaceae bacterium]